MTQPSPASDALLQRLTELEAENGSLLAAKRDLEAFVYAISHDIGAPLRAIDGFSKLLAEDLPRPLSPTAARDLAGIEHGIVRMRELLTCWLAIARCDRAELRREQVDVSAIAAAVHEEIKIAEPHRKVTISIHPGLTAHADPTLTRELLQNLISNAWKFTDLAAPGQSIEVGARRDGGELCFFVRDTGVGFDPAQAQTVFQPFKRLHDSARFSGAGVGLAIAQHIVDRHHGRIWAEGAPGAGATFWFTLSAAPHAPTVSDLMEHPRIGRLT
jgi:light-regulated signal transduction histidine kinase (bacteriophytochrome)